MITPAAAQDPSRREVRIPVEGGAVLAGDVLLPDAGPSPAVVSLYPYHKDDVIGSLFDAPRRRLVADGYASLLVDMRGHGGSSGSTGAGFDLAGVEGADAAEVVEWAAAQPWCDGNVGVWGVSYGGMNALAAAVRRPPHLRAIVSVYGAGEVYGCIIAPGGVPAAFNRYLWSAHMLAMDLCPPSRRDDEGRWRAAWDERLQRMRSRPGYAFDWQRAGDDPAYWAPRALDLSAVEVPALIVGGWQDFFADATVHDFAALGSAQRSLVLGPWLHVLPDLAEREPFDWVGEMSAWFDRHLRPSAVPAPASTQALVYVRGADRWRRYDSAWPPASAVEVTLHATAANELSAFPVGGQFVVEYQPTGVTGRRAGFFDPLGTGFGTPEDQHEDDVASLRFDTAPLAQPLQLAGSPRCELGFAGPTPGDLRLVAKLSEVGPDGTSDLLASGWLSVPAGSGRAELALTPLAATVQPGRRLRLALSTSDFPRYWPSATLVPLSLVLGGEAGCSLTLPVVAGDDGGEDWSEKLRRPVPGEPRPDWVRRGAVSQRRSVAEPGGWLETELVLSSELAPPHGAVLSFDERFVASIAAAEPSSARVEGEVRIEVDDGADWHVEVAVSSRFAEREAVVRSSVTVNGEPVFEQTWGELPAGAPGAG